jgi:hypothetical protein
MANGRKLSINASNVYVIPGTKKQIVLYLSTAISLNN